MSRKRPADHVFNGPAKEYRRTGDGNSKQKSTANGWRSALRQCDIFLGTKKLPTHDNLTFEQFQLCLLQECATFLSFDAVGDDAMPLSLGTAWQYFGSIKNFYKSKFPRHEMWKDQAW